MTSTHYDVVVLGAGSGGIGAALTAAQHELSVLLVEKADVIGGTAVRAGVSIWEAGAGAVGLPFEIYRRLKTLPEAVGIGSFGRHFLWNGPESFPGAETVIDPDRAYADTLRRCGARSMAEDEAFCREHWHSVIFEPRAYVRVVREMLDATANCAVVTETTFGDVDFRGGCVRALTLSNGETVTARAFVDATGDAALCRACGCAMMQGQEGRAAFAEPSAPRDPNRRVNGITLVFRIRPDAGETIEPVLYGIPADCWWADAFPPVSICRYPNGDCNVNALPTMSGEEAMRLGYGRAHEECQRRVRAHWQFLQKTSRHFRRFRLSWIAPTLGVRETVRTVTEYVLTEHDLQRGLSGQSHGDVIAIADHTMDRHGEGSGCVELQEPYGIPYRCLVPRGCRNLLVACRAAGFSSIAASSCRLARTVMLLGQAAGTAIALSAQRDLNLAELSPDLLRMHLERQHVQLEWPMPDALKAYVGEA